MATVPSGFCFGLQHITIDFFATSKKEIEPFFLVTKWSNGDFEKMLAAQGFSYSYSWLGMFSRKLDWFYLKMSLEAFVKLPALYTSYLKLIKKHKPDILFFANHHELILLLPVLWITKIKVVCHMHDPSPAIPFQIKTFKQYGKRVDKFIAISNSVKDRLMQLGCSTNKITVVPNGIHLPDLIVGRKFQFIQSAGWKASDFIIGITGQMTETKGHEDVIEAFELAYKNNKQLRLVIGGKPLEPYYSHLQELVINKGLKQVVLFSGWLKDAN
ncbi:MAG: glycosyltransferase family 4 protein, partial [Methylotenera sp.]|nr:glycosyltransferase family 4 protein [Flavobacterium sp.]